MRTESNHNPEGGLLPVRLPSRTSPDSTLLTIRESRVPIDGPGSDDPKIAADMADFVVAAHTCHDQDQSIVGLGASFSHHDGVSGGVSPTLADPEFTNSPHSSLSNRPRRVRTSWVALSILSGERS